MMHRLLGAASVLALLSGCSGLVDSSSSDSAQNALSKPSSGSTAEANRGGGEHASEMAGCLGAFATCVRNGGGEIECIEALRACGPRPGDHPRPPNDACEDGPRPPGEPPPPPREPWPAPDGGEGDLPPPPPGDYEGDRPPFPPGDYEDDFPPPPPGDHEGDRPPPPPGPPCLELLIACANGTDAIEICVERALGCFADVYSAPPPPPPPMPPHEGEGEGEEPPRPPEDGMR